MLYDSRYIRRMSCKGYNMNASERISIAVAADNNYAPYLSSLIQSILENTCKPDAIDFFVMSKDLSKRNRSFLQHQVEDASSTITFINLASMTDALKDIKLTDWFTVEILFRLLLPDLLPNIDKILYLDSDMIVLGDVADLFRIDLGSNLIGACLDPDMAGNCAGYDPDRKNYLINEVGLSDPYAYFQSGMVLMNLAQFRQDAPTSTLLQIASSKTWKYNDQDTLNNVAYGRVTFCHMKWNFLVDWGDEEIRSKTIFPMAPEYIFEEYKEAALSPCIIHYAGFQKPWDCPHMDWADSFWRYARSCPLYEQILLRLTEKARKKDREELNELKRGLNLEIRDRQNQIDDVWESLSQAWDAIQNHRGRIEELAKTIETIEEYSSAPTWRKIADCFFPKGSKRRQKISSIREMIRKQ